MKKRWIICVILSICVLILSGVVWYQYSNKNNSEKSSNNDKKEYIYEEIDVSKNDIPSNEIEKIQSGIKDWAKSTLVIDSTFSDKDKDILNEKLYEIIVPGESKDKFIKSQKNFYKDNSIRTNDVSVVIKSSKQATYNKKALGVVECFITFRGVKDSKYFIRSYDATLLVEYKKNIVSIYEIGDISVK